MIIRWLISPTVWLLRASNLWYTDSAVERWDSHLRTPAQKSFYSLAACRRSVSPLGHGSSYGTFRSICSKASV